MTPCDSLQLLSDPQHISYFEQSHDFQRHLQSYIKRRDTAPKEPESYITASEAMIEFYHLLLRFRVLGSLIIEPYDGATMRPLLLGQGGQFSVYKGYRWNPDLDGMAELEPDDELFLEVYWQPVALKRPFFERFADRIGVPNFRTGPTKDVDLSDRKVQQSIKNMVHEILALQHPGLVGHPYIVQLIGWSSFKINGCLAPCLVLPLARSDLREHLESHRELSHEERLAYCEGLGSALDTLHRFAIIHGDIKFENVLVFRAGGRFVPKISDFGFSVTAEENDGGFVALSGTPGWIAPEVKQCIETGKKLPIAELHKADNYSYGLLVERTMSYGGFQCPPDVAELVTTVVVALKAEHPHDRPSFVGNLLTSQEAVNGTGDDNPTFGHGLERSPDPFPDLVFDYDAPDDEVSMAVANPGGAYEASILSLFRHDPGRVSSRTLFGFVLFRPDIDTEVLLSMLTTSATRGHCISQGVCTIVHRHFGKPVLAEKALIKVWLRSAVESGSWLAARELSRLSPESVLPAQNEFRRRGGYASDRRYQIKNIDPAVTLETLPAENCILNQQGDTSLHLLSSLPSQPAFTNCLSGLAGGISINHQNEYGETALSRACMSGQTENVLSLLGHGADPSLVLGETDGQVSCLHWLFIFPVEDQKAVAKALLTAGADLNSVAWSESVILHYPFWLPRGTPLHWAVYTGSMETCKVLLELGAELGVRDGSDPYRYEKNVRMDVQYEHPPIFPETLGLSVLDLAVKLHYAEFLEHLAQERRLQCKPLLNDRDEEGYTPFHRFHAGQYSEILNATTDKLHVINETNRFSTATFNNPPSSPERRGKLQRCVNALVEIGLDVNSVTSPQHATVAGGYIYGGCTPLGLSMKELDLDMSSVLLSTTGQDIHTRLPNGNTPLFTLGHNVEGKLDDHIKASALQESIRRLIAAGIDIHTKNDYGITAAGWFGIHLPTIRALVAHGSRVTDTITQPHAADRLGDTSTVLISVLESPQLEDDNIPSATEAFRLELVERFVPDAQAAAQHVKRYGTTLLHCAARAGSVNITRVLLKRGLDPAAKCVRTQLSVPMTPRVFATPLDDLRERLRPLRAEKRISYFGGAEAHTEATIRRYEETEALLLEALMKRVVVGEAR